MGGLAVVLLLLIIFLGVEGAREAIGGFFNFVLWGVILILVLCFLGKIGEAFKDNRASVEKAADEKRLAKEKELEKKRNEETKKAMHGAARFWLRAFFIATISVVAICAIAFLISEYFRNPH